MNRFGYCERASEAFWAEPLNALSNGSFFLAALAAWLLLRRSDRRDLPAESLTGLVLAIGIGSFLFHTMPQRWTLLADVIPIQLFALGYFGLALNRFLGLSPLLAGLGAFAFLGASFGLAAGLAPLLPAGMRGSAGYAGFVLGLFGVAFALQRREPGSAAARLIGLGGLVFALSLGFRSLDAAACDQLPFGLHWAWHLLNGLLLYLLLRAAILPARARRAQRQLSSRREAAVTPSSEKV